MRREKTTSNPCRRMGRALAAVSADVSERREVFGNSRTSPLRRRRYLARPQCPEGEGEACDLLDS